MMSAIEQWLHDTVLGDRLAMGTFFFGGIFLLWYELIYVAAFNHTTWSLGYTAHVLMSAVLAVNIYGNWLMVYLTAPTGPGVIFPSGPTPSGWRYCGECEGNRPPRSHHCPLCKACTLKHDHHCWFTGRCVGHDNHRYFFVLSAYLMLAALYCNAYNWPFVCHVKGKLTFYSCLSLVLPHLTAILGYETLTSFFINSVTMTGFALLVVFTGMFVAQLQQVVQGQTRYERKKKVWEFDQGVWSNLRGVLGQHMFWALLCPWFPSPLPGNGINFSSHCQKIH